MRTHKSQKDQLEKGAKIILESLGINLHDENFINTPKRIADSILFYYRGIVEKESILEQLKISFPSRHKNFIIMRNLKGTSLCPHHLLPIEYTADFVYIPNNRVVGASKPYKVFEILAAQPIMQEDLTEEYIREFYKIVKPLGCMIIVTGSFFCHDKSNINHHLSTMITKNAAGIFNKDINYEQRFYSLIK
jgi:GTP cyclohydrolase IA